MDSIQIVCEECFFINLKNEANAALEGVNAGAAITMLIQKAKRMVLNIFERIVTVVRNIRNLFRKQKKVYLTENSIKMIREGISIVNKATHMVDDLPSILGIQLVRSGYETVQQKIDRAYEVADDIMKMNSDFSYGANEKTISQKYGHVNRPYDGKLVEYTDYSTDMRYLEQVESRMTALVDSLKKESAKIEAIERKNKANADGLSDFARALRKTDEEYGAKHAWLIRLYFSAYGSASTQLLKLVTRVQHVINTMFQVARSKGVKTPDDLKRNSKYVEDFGEIKLEDDD